MGQAEIISKLKERAIVVVIRGESKEEGVKCALACISGGIKAIEVAYTNKHASHIISDLASDIHLEDVLVGAGTVLDSITAREAILAGAQYIVSPSFSEQVAQICHLYAIPYIPGCMTLTEMTTALASGCDMVKLFPASSFGPKYIAAVRAPLPQISLMVTGGVNVANAQEWFDAGATAIGIGGEFNQLASQGAFDQISEMATQYTALRKA